MPELRPNVEPRFSGLTTADLADLDEPQATIQSHNQQLELERLNSQRIESLDSDLPTADPFLTNARNLDATEYAYRSETAPETATIGDMDKTEFAYRKENSPLFTQQEADAFHSRWNAIQAGFVDEPRQAVRRADELVASAIKRLAEIFAEERSNLDQQWARGGEVSTEDLRIALQRYRSFFGRLLSV